MSHACRLSRTRIPVASFLLACACLQGCLLSWGGKDGIVKENPPVARGFYTFLQPTESSRLHFDSVHTVQWQASDSAGDGKVRMYLYRDQERMGDVSISLPASGSIYWHPASTILNGPFAFSSGSGYRFRIVNLSDTSRDAYGPAFSLYSRYSGTLELTAPTQGFKVEDSVLQVAWTVSGEVGDSVGLHLYLDSRMMTGLTNSVSAAAGVFSWPVDLATMPTGDDYRIRIFSLSDTTIAHMGPAFTFDTPVRSGTYEFIRPRAGEVWIAGELVELDWTVTGTPGVMTALTLWRDVPRELIREYTPIDTYNPPPEFRAPSDLADGTYRLRLVSTVDSTLQTFSPAFLIQGGEPLDQ